MRRELDAIKVKLAKMQERAADLAGSDNEVTADKYGDVEGLLDEAVEAIQAVIERLEEEA